MRAIHELRSQIEHLNDLDPFLPGASDRIRKIAFLKSVLLTESVARHCVRQLLADQQLWPHFRDGAAVTAFWAKIRESERMSKWGAPFDLAGYLPKIDDLQIAN